MDVANLLHPLLGGVLIGIAASLLLLLTGRIFGVSGIIAGILKPKAGDNAWRVAAVAGLLTAGLIIHVSAPEMLVGETSGGAVRWILAGLLVGFGTQMGSGCTSGHGVCGISRFSPRSILSTLTFMGVGIAMVAIIRSAGGVP